MSAYFPLRNTPSILKYIILIINLLVLTACASVKGPPTEGDPFESYNRAMFSFNDGLDEYIFRPVAEGYKKVIPDPIKTGISNFFSNIGDIFVILNDLLQFKFKQAFSDSGRFIFNSTLGIYGLFDVATPMGMVKHDEDFGQTLATWGVGDGPYIVLPFLGPSTLRDTSGLVVTAAVDINNKIDPIKTIKQKDTYYATVFLEGIDARYNLLNASKIIDQAALDKYSFIRDAYLQLRKNQIYDGNPPESKREKPPERTPEDLELEKLLELELGL